MTMTTSTHSGASNPKIIQWLLDTRPLWPVPHKAKPREEVEQLKTVASRALALLTPAEQASVLRFYHVKDAKMSLASHLLKHLVITRHCNVSWSQSTLSRDSNGKPRFIPPSGQATIDFNVSHQAGIVSLIAVVGVTEKVEVGTDVVCVNERITQDYAHIEKAGFFDWVDIHSDMFAETEISYMKLAPLELGLDGEVAGFGRDAVSRCQWRNRKVNITVRGVGEDEDKTVTIDSNAIIDAKLRRFYACWCLREAYIKMTGEALLAPWLRELEILEVRAPAARKGLLDVTSLEDGEIETDFKIIFKGRPVTNVRIELVALGNNYMVGAAVRPVGGALDIMGLEIGKWKHLDLERDILDFAESKP